MKVPIPSMLPLEAERGEALWHPPFEVGWTTYRNGGNWQRCRSGQLFMWHTPEGRLIHEGHWSFAGMYSKPYKEGFVQVHPPQAAAQPPAREWDELRHRIGGMRNNALSDTVGPRQYSNGIVWATNEILGWMDEPVREVASPAATEPPAVRWRYFIYPKVNALYRVPADGSRGGACDGRDGRGWVEANYYLAIFTESIRAIETDESGQPLAPQVPDGVPVLPTVKVLPKLIERALAQLNWCAGYRGDEAKAEDAADIAQQFRDILREQAVPIEANQVMP